MNFRHHPEWYYIIYPSLSTFPPIFFLPLKLIIYVSGHGDLRGQTNNLNFVQIQTTIYLNFTG